MCAKFLWWRELGQRKDAEKNPVARAGETGRRGAAEGRAGRTFVSHGQMPMWQGQRLSRKTADSWRGGTRPFRYLLPSSIKPEVSGQCFQSTSGNELGGPLSGPCHSCCDLIEREEKNPIP